MFGFWKINITKFVNSVEEYVQVGARMVTEMKKANDLKEKELTLIRERDMVYPPVPSSSDRPDGGPPAESQQERFGQVPAPKPCPSSVSDRPDGGKCESQEEYFGKGKG